MPTDPMVPKFIVAKDALQRARKDWNAARAAVARADATGIAALNTAREAWNAARERHAAALAASKAEWEAARKRYDAGTAGPMAALTAARLAKMDAQAKYDAIVQASLERNKRWDASPPPDDEDENY